MPLGLLQANPWSILQIQQALEEVTDLCILNNPSNPFQMLAQMRLPIYVTTWTLIFDPCTGRRRVEPVWRICHGINGFKRKTSMKNNPLLKNRWYITSSAI
jgi:hypothetical protein